MVYMGSKNRIAKDIIPFMTPFLNGENYFIDAFCGGCNLIDKIDYPNRIANDKNEYLIELFKYLQDDGNLPLEISKEEYYKVKADKDNYPKWYVGFIGFICSFRGKFFDCYIPIIKETSSGCRKYQIEHIENIKKQIHKLQNVKFLNCNYEDLEIKKGDIVYCDPPYQNTKKYKNSINYDVFWEWCRLTTKRGSKVFISEYSAPDDFKCIWVKKLKKALPTGDTLVATEKLFVHESIFDEVMSKQNKYLFN